MISSNYNSRPRAAEVLVDDDRFAIVRARESSDDLVRLGARRTEWRDALMRMGVIADTHDRVPAVDEFAKRFRAAGGERGAARRRLLRAVVAPAPSWNRG